MLKLRPLAVEMRVLLQTEEGERTLENVKETDNVFKAIHGELTHLPFAAPFMSTVVDFGGNAVAPESTFGEIEIDDGGRLSVQSVFIPENLRLVGKKVYGPGGYRGHYDVHCNGKMIVHMIPGWELCGGANKEGMSHEGYEDATFELQGSRFWVKATHVDKAQGDWANYDKKDAVELDLTEYAKHPHEFPQCADSDSDSDPDGGS